MIQGCGQTGLGVGAAHVPFMQLSPLRHELAAGGAPQGAPTPPRATHLLVVMSQVA